MPPPHWLYGLAPLNHLYTLARISCWPPEDGSNCDPKHVVVNFTWTFNVFLINIELWVHELVIIETNNWGSHSQENILSHFGVWSKNKAMNRENQEDYKGQIWVSRYHSRKCQDYGCLRRVLCPEGGQIQSQIPHCTSNYGITRAHTWLHIHFP